MPKIRQKDLNEMARISKICGHPKRLLILGILYSGKHNVSELVNLSGMQQTTVSQMLFRFRMEKIVHEERDGVKNYYTISDPRIIPFLDALDELCKVE